MSLARGHPQFTRLAFNFTHQTMVVYTALSRQAKCNTTWQEHQAFGHLGRKTANESLAIMEGVFFFTPVTPLKWRRNVCEHWSYVPLWHWSNSPFLCWKNKHESCSTKFLTPRNKKPANSEAEIDLKSLPPTLTHVGTMYFPLTFVVIRASLVADLTKAHH